MQSNTVNKEIMFFSEKLMKIPTIQRKAAIRAAY